MNKKITKSTQTTQLQPNLSPQVQEALTMLNIRVNDMLAQFNVILNMLVKENAELEQQIKQQTPTTQTVSKTQI